MRASVWWSAAALALLAVTSALRTTQVEGASRIGRRLPAPLTSDVESSTEADQVEIVQSTIRSRNNRRRNEILSRDVRTRSQSQSRRPVSSTETVAETEKPQSQDGRNQRYESRRTIGRTRNKLIENASSTTLATPSRRNIVARGRVRSITDQTPSTSTQSSLSASSQPIDITSSTETKIEVMNSMTDDITKVRSNGADQFKRRSSSIDTIETVAPKRIRGRINTRPNARSLDLDVAGTTNSLSNLDKAPTTAKTASDLKNSRKLRYKTRLSETDTNLTGEGIKVTNEVIKSSQKDESITSQPETQTITPTVIASTESSIVQSSTEKSPVKDTVSKVMKVVRRPLSRGKVNFRPVASLPKKTATDEISEDDNYPESFKALIQAKNASTQSSSPSSESLTLKASQKIYKTYTTPSQSLNIGLGNNKYSRYRNNLNAQEDSKKKDKGNENITTAVPETKSIRSDYRPRGTFNPRSRKLTSFSSQVTSTTASLSSSTVKPAYKFNRKFKITTTKAPEPENKLRTNTNTTDNLLKRSTARSSYFPRKNITNFENKAVVQKVDNRIDDTSSTKIQKNIVPRTSYYSRLRNNKIGTKSTTVIPKEITNEIDSIEKKTEDTLDMPLIYTLLKNPTDIEITTEENKKNEKGMFIIAVSSKEYDDVKTGNDMLNTAAETENKPIVNESSTSEKYHSLYTESETTNYKSNAELTTQRILSSTHVRNIQARKSSRKNINTDNESKVVTPRSRARSSRKYSESFSKSTEASTNGITSEPDKPKIKFSSKYRASYLDKPFYKPTVPTITSSTAWLKFFITDPVLTKSVQEPYWFEGEDFTDVTTESMTRPNTTAPSIIHESPLQLVKGEEIYLGPDMNAISFTKARSKLYSADLRLSESLVKPSHIMNVEASQHSPSVTVSIFDALAEILTSTPRTRLSSTTEVLKKANLNNDVLQTLNGVSNNNNVNNVRALDNQDTLTSTNIDANTSAKSVQNVDPTPNVNNSFSVEENILSSLNTEGRTVTTVNIAQPNTMFTSIPTPTTPLSDRRPFAFKVLYSATESPTDKFTTGPESTPIQGSTDNPTTVYNTVSDLLIPSNNVVSSELTSMLSNNILDIIQNLDESSRVKVSLDMAKLLKTLIPRALDILTTMIDDVDTFVPNTTPYTLEEIKDTENVKLNNSLNFLQNVVNVNNIKASTVTATVNVNDNITLSVNSTDNIPIIASTLPMSGSSQQTMTPNSATSPITVSNTTPISTIVSTSDTLGTGRVIDSMESSIPDSANKPVPTPFFTNFRLLEETSNPPLQTKFTEPAPLSQYTNTNDPAKVSSLQLWVLSKKARVLKMIEELIKQHNQEIATAPSLSDSDIVESDNIPLSNRLTKIMNTFTSTTESTDPTNSDDFSSPTNIPSSILNAITISSRMDGIRNRNSQDSLDMDTSSPSDILSTTTTNIVSQTTTDQMSVNTIKTTEQTTIQTSTEGSIETTTDINSAQETTEIITNTSTNIDTELFNSSSSNNVTKMLSDETTQNLATDVNKQTIIVGSTVPKKDYVIFGILPNDTVVRKDPNDDILESLTEASPYIIYGVLPNNTVIRKFPNGTRVPRFMQKIDVLPISPGSLRNPYSPIHNNPAIVRPKSNPIRVSTNTVIATDSSNNGSESRLTTDTVNNQQLMISSSALNIKDSSSLGVTTTNKPPAEKSTASHVLSLRTSTMLPSVDEILLNSISSAAKEELVISSMTSSTHEPRILTLDIDPETKQIRTEKPGEGNGNAVFKFIPIDEVTVAPQKSNVLKLATKVSTESNETQSTTASTITEMNTQTPQIQTRIEIGTSTTTISGEMSTAMNTIQESTSILSTTVETAETIPPTSTLATTTSKPVPPVTLTSLPITTTLASTTTTSTAAPTTMQLPLTTSNQFPTTTKSTPVITTESSTTTTAPIVSTTLLPTTSSPPITSDEEKRYQEDAQILQQLLQLTRDPKNLNIEKNTSPIFSSDFTSTTFTPISTFVPSIGKQNEEAKLLQALLSTKEQSSNPLITNINGNLNIPGATSTTSRSIEDDLRQLEEDTKLLKALLQATGQNPKNFNLPTFDFTTTARAQPSSTIPLTSTTTTTTTSTTSRPTIVTTTRPITTLRTTTMIYEDIRKLQEDTKLLQALLQAVGQNTGNVSPPIISGVTSNVRIASNPLTTSLGSNPTTPLNVRPVYTTQATTPASPVFSFVPRTFSTLQPVSSTMTENIKISTTISPRTTTIRRNEPVTLTARRVPVTRVTTDMPSTSTFSVEEDLAFLKNLKTVLKTNPNSDDPEVSLANRIIALAVEKSLNEIETGTSSDTTRTGKNISNNVNNIIPTTVPRTTTTPRTTTITTTTTTPRPTTTTIKANLPSIEDDIKQFQEDTKLLQALIKATGQDPSKFNIPTLPNLTTVKVSPKPANAGLKPSSPSPLNKPSDSLSSKSKINSQTKSINADLTKPFGAKIAVKDDLKTIQDDEKLLKTLVKLQDVQETTTQKNKLTITGQTSDEALKKLLQQQSKNKGMVSDATQAPMSLSTEFGKSNDALLAALLKEQGFGPTTASSLDEQLRLSALLNQVVVTPKAQRTTTPPPPPQQRRPILDGLAWLWQQWRETAPGPTPPRPSRRPSPSASPTISSSAATSNRVNWFGSGPFIGNADDKPPANRIPLEPPRAVTSEQTPGRGQLVSAAINVTRAFSQFLGAAIQGAAQTVQNVIRAGQKVATDVYVGGSGGSGASG